VPILGLSHFVHARILHEDHDHTISMLYERGTKVLRLPNSALLPHSCEQLTLQLDQLESARHSISGPPRTRGRAHREAAGQVLPQPQWDTGYESGILGYHGGGSSYYPHNIPGPSHRAGISASTEFPHWYYPLERYIIYGVDQAQRAVEGIRWIKSRMDELEHVQMEMYASIDSQTDMLHSLFDHFGIDPDA
jgi:hypothetical protein